MKIIGAGFGRTGTMSLKAALEQLGFGPCHHMTEVIENPEQQPAWVEAALGEPVDWDEMLAGYESTMDWPACLFWKELSDKYPDAKIILNTRDPERWYDSVENTFLKMWPDDFSALPPETPPEFAALFEVVKAVMDAQFGDIVSLRDKAHALEVFRKHYENVEATAPADRLLVYEVKEGWAPLCEFLGVPVPDEPFPRLNDRESLISMAEARRAEFAAGKD